MTVLAAVYLMIWLMDRWGWYLNSGLPNHCLAAAGALPL
jgi:hypothetical protein